MGRPIFNRILIANRGEIAVRIIKTARRLGVRTVAVFSEADTGAAHVALADEAIAIGPSPAAESYLRADKILAAALHSGAEAIHPGFGFLSENPDFAEQVVDAGLVFVGPTAASIRAMGLKDRAKALMEQAGVPVVPGYHGGDQSANHLAVIAEGIGFPLLIKARAGGGGRGMRKVEGKAQFMEALASARREAKAAFGDDAVLLEKYVTTPRHIEVQVFGDQSGGLVHLFERDCSMQRRHQKVIEESPAPGMSEEMRAAMTHAALKAAKAVAYCNAGTVEFIADASEGLRPDRFWFMEMNTRLQVEHPVTEMVTGFDLVEWQLRVAAGEPLPARQEDIRLNGHAIEARLCAEDAAGGFLPATGTFHHLKFPDAEAGRKRVDSGIRSGDAASPFYDSMMAKIIVHGEDRAEALSTLSDMLDDTQAAGVKTNLAFLSSLVRDEDFAAGAVDTGLVERKQQALTSLPSPREAVIATAIGAAELSPEQNSPNDPWSALAGYAHFHPLERTISLGFGDAVVSRRVIVENGHPRIMDQVGEASRLPFAVWPGHVTVFDGARTYDFQAPDPLDRQDDLIAAADAMLAPMPGLIRDVRGKVGESVAKGQVLVVLEAMKMEHAIAATHDGVIAEIAREGEQVSEGTVLVRFASSDE